MAQAKAMAPQPQRGPVLAKAALRAAERLGLSGRQLAAIVGVSEPTVSRWKRGDSLPDEGTKPFELAVLFVRVFRSLDAITGGDEHVARAWLTNPVNRRSKGTPDRRSKGTPVARLWPGDSNEDFCAGRGGGRA